MKIFNTRVCPAYAFGFSFGHSRMRVFPGSAFNGLLIAGMLLLAACGGGGGDGGGGGGGGPMVVATTGASVDMTGTWSGECRYDVIDDLARKDTHIFSGSTMTFSEATWLGNVNCTGSPDAVDGGAMTVSVGSTVNATWIDSATGSTVPPAGLPSPVLANKVLLSGPGPPGFTGKEIWVVDDSGAPLDCYFGWVDAGTPVDAEGYPTEVFSNMPVTK